MEELPRTLKIRNDEMTYRAYGYETGGIYSLIEMTIGPGGGPPVHVHTEDDESFLILEGRFLIIRGDEQREVGPGDYVYGPRGVPHGFTNIGETPGRLLIVDSPPRIEGYFRELSEHSVAGSLNRVVQEELYAKYGMAWVAPPLQARSAAFYS